MDLVERLFGLSPDAGSGSFELLCFAVLSLCVHAIGMARQRRRHPTRR